MDHTRIVLLRFDSLLGPGLALAPRVVAPLLVSFFFRHPQFRFYRMVSLLLRSVTVIALQGPFRSKPTQIWEEIKEDINKRPRTMA